MTRVIRFDARPIACSDELAWSLIGIVPDCSISM